MSHLISIELDSDVAKNILKQLENMAMPPLDEQDLAQYKLYEAIEEALANDDAEDE